MAGPRERDQFTDEEEEDDDELLDAGLDEQGLGSGDELEEGGGVGVGAGAGGKRKRSGKSLGGGGFGKRGVCYLSRIPPHMNPSHIRQMLSKYGEVLRIYLVPQGNRESRRPRVEVAAEF
jgi:ESF2/ABP1 family protein